MSWQQYSRTLRFHYQANRYVNVVSFWIYITNTYYFWFNFDKDRIDRISWQHRLNFSYARNVFTEHATKASTAHSRWQTFHLGWDSRRVPPDSWATAELDEPLGTTSWIRYIDVDGVKEGIQSVPTKEDRRRTNNVQKISASLYYQEPNLRIREALRIFNRRLCAGQLF